MILRLLLIPFLWWWEKRVEGHLYYYADGKLDATRAIQRQLNYASWGIRSRNTAAGVTQLVKGTYLLKAPLEARSNTTLRGEHPASTLLNHGFVVGFNVEHAAWENIVVRNADPAFRILWRYKKEGDS